MLRILLCVMAVSAASAAEPAPNRLIHEKSLYLKQHARNPVDWYPWGDEAFEKARREDRPIMLSIGYSTCHWCHVMERESFEDPSIAALLAESFVAIKVDREERPDVDQIYMDALQLTGKSGGWPLTMFLTPDLRPFHGGTYYPPVSSHGQPSFRELLTTVAATWKSNRDQLVKASQDLQAILEKPAGMRTPGEVTASLIDGFQAAYLKDFDPLNGGFGKAPKFPPSRSLRVFLGHWQRTGSADSRRMVDVTLDAMDRGGLQDQIGGGFHRYSTDDRWLVPHFEKMLYDNALLATIYLEAYQATGVEARAAVARRTLDAMLRDFRHPEGAFHAATDADSEGAEGTYFVWKRREILDLLGAEEGALVADWFGVTEQGNFEQGTSVLHRPATLEDFAGARKLDPDSLRGRIEVASAKLLEARARRTPPATDTKVITSWNALMVSALARGAQVLGDARYRAAAIEAGEFLATRMVEGGVVHRRYADGERRHPGVLADHSYLADAFFDLHETTFDPLWIERARAIVKSMRSRFGNGPVFFEQEARADLIVRSREDTDSAIPSGSAVAWRVMNRLARLSGDAAMENSVGEGLESVAGILKVHPLGHSSMILAVEAWLSPRLEIVVASEPGSSELEAFMKPLRRMLLPGATLAVAGGPDRKRAEALIPVLVNKVPVGGKPTAYVCANRVCRRPTTDPEEMAAEIRKILKVRD